MAARAEPVNLAPFAMIRMVSMQETSWPGDAASLAAARLDNPSLMNGVLQSPARAHLERMPARFLVPDARGIAPLRQASVSPSRCLSLLSLSAGGRCDALAPALRRTRDLLASGAAGGSALGALVTSPASRRRLHATRRPLFAAGSAGEAGFRVAQRLRAVRGIAAHRMVSIALSSASLARSSHIASTVALAVSPNSRSGVIGTLFLNA